jgi:AcrR family transcriptional regulator
MEASTRTPTGRDARQALFEAGRRIADEGRAGDLKPAIIAREAGLAEGVFHACFPDESDFLLALHRHFLNGILRQVIMSLVGQVPGNERIRRGVQRFLDGCVQQRGLRDLLLRLESHPEMRETARIRRQAFMEMLRLEFKAAGWAHPIETARLYRVMVEEAAAAELEAGKELPLVRHVLWQFLRLEGSL